MTPAPGPYEIFYDGALQHPILLWAAAVAALVFCRTRSRLDPTLRRYCTALVLLSVLDAWLTTRHVFGVGQLPAWLQSAVPLFFVLAGDARFLLLVCAGTAAGSLDLNARAVRQAAGLTLVVPLLSQAVTAVLPASLSGARVLYFVYEIAFVALTLALLRWHPRLAAAPWLRNVARFVILYYSLWALADALLLAFGWDLAFLLRVLPNLLYYGGLIAAIAWLAPRGESRAEGA